MIQQTFQLYSLTTENSWGAFTSVKLKLHLDFGIVYELQTHYWYIQNSKNVGIHANKL